MAGRMIRLSPARAGVLRCLKAGDVKNPYLRKPKKQLTIRLDEDTIDYFRALAEKNGVPYQNLINLYLRDCAQSNRKIEHEMGVIPSRHGAIKRTAIEVVSR